MKLIWLKRGNKNNYWTAHDINEYNVADPSKEVGWVVLKSDGTFQYWVDYPGFVKFDYVGHLEECLWMCEQKILIERGLSETKRSD